MDGITKLEAQKKITEIVDNIVRKIDEVVPEEWDKNQVASVFQLYLSIYR